MNFSAGACAAYISAGIGRRRPRQFGSGWGGNVNEDFFDGSVRPETLTADGMYTQPRSWGVYKLTMAAGQGRQYRFGNHPVRQRELEREFGRVQVLSLFLSRLAAEEAVRRCLANRR